MKRFALSLLFLVLGLGSSAQNLHLKISGNSERENKLVDSIGYQQNHINAKSIVDEGNLLSDKLTRLGFIENEILENKKNTDTTFSIRFNIGKKTDFIHIYISDNPLLKSISILKPKEDTLILSLNKAEGFLKEILNSLEKNGYSLARIKLVNFKKIKNGLYADLNVEIGNKRQVNDIVINGYDKFPEGHKKNIRRLYKNKTFNQENLKKIHDDFESFRFVRQTKYPQILFTKDTTKVFVYLEKSKPNKFDGLIGFSNDEKSKLQFNGYLDLLLVNTLNSGEEFTLYWKSDGNKQKTFNAGLELPYIFKSRFGLKTSLNIFKQDSTFQNTKTAIDIGYFFNYNTRLYLGYQSTESSDIQNQNNSSISDYKNSFKTLNFEFRDFKTDDYLFPEKTIVSIKTGLGSRNSKLNSNNQIFVNLNLSHNLNLSEKSSFNLKSQNYYLKSDEYIINELYRFGGINSIRGFNENSLQASSFTSILTEYRYVVTSSLYAHSILDYGYYNDKTSKNKGGLLGIGFGFGILTKNGLLNIIYANGSANNQEIKLSNSIVHISFKANF